MIDKSQITPGTPIVGSDGVLVGTVEGMEGDFIQLRVADSPDGQPRYLPASVIADQSDGKLITLMNHAAMQSLLQDSPEPGEAGTHFLSSS